MTGRLTGLLGLLLAAGAASGVLAEGQEQAPPPSINEWSQRMLNEHNRARDEASVPRLRWSGKLAREAQAWAEVLAREGRMRHSDGQVGSGAGENLWMGSAGYFGPEAMIGTFVEEKQYFLRGTFPRVSSTGRWEDVGHYTQVVWRDTREVGCAVARNARDDFLVCRYWPAGNWMGEAPF